MGEGGCVRGEVTLGGGQGRNICTVHILFRKVPGMFCTEKKKYRAVDVLEKGTSIIGVKRKTAWGGTRIMEQQERYCRRHG